MGGEKCATLVWYWGIWDGWAGWLGPWHLNGCGPLAAPTRLTDELLFISLMPSWKRQWNGGKITREQIQNGDSVGRPLQKAFPLRRMKSALFGSRIFYKALSSILRPNSFAKYQGWSALNQSFSFCLLTFRTFISINSNMSFPNEFWKQVELFFFPFPRVSFGASGTPNQIASSCLRCSVYITY